MCAIKRSRLLLYTAIAGHAHVVSSPAIGSLCDGKCYQACPILISAHSTTGHSIAHIAYDTAIASAATPSILNTTALYDVFHGKGCSKAFKLTLMRSVREAAAAVAAKGGDGSGTFIEEAMLSALAVVPDD
eukprot:7879-Heterococcus_DN1.PRE.2